MKTKLLYFLPIFSVICLVGCSRGEFVKDSSEIVSKPSVALPINKSTTDITANPLVRTTNSDYLKKLNDLAYQLPGSLYLETEDKKPLVTKDPKTLREPASILKLITATEYLQKVKPSAYVDKYKMSALDLSKYLMITSDNLIAEYMGNTVGINHLQKVARTVTNNKSIIITNGSGCNEGTVGNHPHDCGPGPTLLEPVMISAYDMVQLMPYIESKLKEVGTTFEELTGYIGSQSSSLNSRYGQYFTDLPNIQLSGKIGGLSAKPMRSLTGFLITQSGKKVYYTLITPGPKESTVKAQSELLKAVYYDQP